MRKGWYTVIDYDKYVGIWSVVIYAGMAETMRLIYRLFMQGQTPYALAKYLTDKAS